VSDRKNPSEPYANGTEVARSERWPVGTIAALTWRRIAGAVCKVRLVLRGEGHCEHVARSDKG
jgi:hypothetical protein